MYKIILICILCLFLTGCWAVPEPIPPKPDGVVYRALLVGVGDYANFGFPVDLQSPPYNVDRVREVLENSGHNFTIINELKDLDATKENILNGIVSTFAESDNNDVSYFYWNGHGGTRIEPHINPTDTKHTPETWISLSELEDLFDSIAGTKVIIMDTCFSGQFIDKSGNFTKALNKGGYYVLTSCKGSQECHEFDYYDPPYCVFTMGFYQGCMAGVTELKSLCDYINNWVNENHPDFDQIAQCYPDDSLFPIVKY